MLTPDTRTSVLIRLNPSARESVWDEFVLLYRPLVVRVAVAKGLQHADAEDVAQNVLIKVQHSIQTFESQGSGSFRAWLTRMTRNLVINQLTRQREPVGTGDSAVREQLEQSPTVTDDARSLFDLELKRLRFQRAVTIVKRDVSDDTWQCFYQTAIQQRSIDDVARRLNKSNGSVRVARCRVLARLRNEIALDESES